MYNTNNLDLMITLDSISKLLWSLRVGIQKIPPQKANDMSSGSQIFNIDSLTFDKSDKHNTICDSYNVEKAVAFIKYIALGNILEAYSLVNQMKYETLNKAQKHMLY